MRDVRYAVFGSKPLSGGLDKGVRFGVNSAATMTVFNPTSRVNAMIDTTRHAIVARANDPVVADDDAADS